MITISESEFDSCSTSKAFALSCAIITSESKVFFEQPNVTTLTLFFRVVFVFMYRFGYKVKFSESKNIF